MDRMHGRFDTMDTPSSLFRSVPSPLFSTVYLVDLVCNPSAVVGTWVWLPTERQLATGLCGAGRSGWRTRRWRKKKLKKTKIKNIC